MSKPVIMIAAGGTGGHLFPAFALSEEFGRRGHLVDLVTDMRGDKFGTGFPARTVHQVPSATLRSKTPWGVARMAFTLLRGIVRARALLREVKPSVIIGFGGYPTVPPLIAARVLNIPVVLHEQNAVMGRANRLLVRFATAIGLTFEKTKYLGEAHRAKAHLVGTPVRDAVLAEAKTPFIEPTPNGKLKLLVFGGSQGARVFSDVVPGALAVLPDYLKTRIKLVQQVREEDMERVRAAYDEAGIDAELETFFSDLPKRMANAHLVIGRAGASTVAELTVLGRPSILVPLPHALDNDQLENATRVQEAGGAWCIEQPWFTSERLADEIIRFGDSPVVLVKAAKAARSIGEPGAVAKLADVIEELAGPQIAKRQDE